MIGGLQERKYEQPKEVLEVVKESVVEKPEQ